MEVVHISPMEQVQQRIVKDVVDAPVPPYLEDIIDVAQSIRKESITKRIGDIVDDPVPEVLQQSVNVVRLIP